MSTLAVSGADNWLALILAVAIGIFLFIALVFPEKL
jgi:K+-transporting ATPase KdpF subunit